MAHPMAELLMNLTDYAIVIGIDEYPGMSSLKGAQNDAQAFAAWLIDPAGGNLPAGNVTRILTDQFPSTEDPLDADPNAQRFNAALHRLLKPNSTLMIPRGRRLYLYFAGHGFQGASTREEAALYAANATRMMPEHIPGTRLADILKDAAVFAEIVLVMDCCRDVSLTGQILEPLLRLPKNSAQAATVRTMYAYAVPRGAQAREYCSMPGGEVRGAFTMALLDALTHTPADANGAVSGEAVKNYLHNNWLKYGSKDVQPKIEIDTQLNPVLVTRAPGASPLTRVVVTLDPAVASGTLVIEDGTFTPFLHIPIIAPQLECQLPQGLYKACVTGTSRERIFQVMGGQANVTC
jgi:hypothetical protein